MKISRKFFKNMNTSNPLLSNVFCADPYGFEYQGRLYVYGTNDQQQYDLVGKNGKNTYELIKSLVCFSTDDMVNWTYHGIIDVGKIDSFYLSSWAPAIVYRKEADGLDHFYLYFSNNGCGVGVLTATSPLGPWTSPLKLPLVDVGMKGIENVPNPFGPGVCLDDNGDGWLVFGGGYAPGGDDAMPGSVRIVKLGRDMLSFASDFAEIPAPYFLEACDLNFINGTYVFSYNNNWVERKKWDYDAPVPSECSMSYMTSKNPLDSKSWTYKNHYFKNPGEQGLNYSNNHTHIFKYQDQWYILYHTLTLQENTETNGGFRSICADRLEINENAVEISLSQGTRQGLVAIKNLNPFENVAGTCMFTSAEVGFEDKACLGQVSGLAEKSLGEETKFSGLVAKSQGEGAWILVKNLDFSDGAEKIFMEASGVGKILVRLDKISSGAVAEICLGENDVAGEETPGPCAIAGGSGSVGGCDTLVAPFLEKVQGVHDVFFIFSQKDICLKGWHVE